MANEELQEYTDANFEAEVLRSEVPVLIDFWAPWCMPCQMVAPIVEDLAQEYVGRAKVGKLNIDDASATAQRYSVITIPTLMVFKNGEAVGRIKGAVPRDKIEKMLADAGVDKPRGPAA